LDELLQDVCEREAYALMGLGARPDRKNPRLEMSLMEKVAKEITAAPRFADTTPTRKHIKERWNS
jgi:hypothetical protein